VYVTFHTIYYYRRSVLQIHLTTRIVKKQKHIQENINKVLLFFYDEYQLVCVFFFCLVILVNN